MKTLAELLEKVDYKRLCGTDKVEISNVSYDSRLVKSGDCFVCIVGATFDAHNIIPEVIAAGASAVIVEKGHFTYDATRFSGNVTIIEVQDCRMALALMSAAYFDHPADKLIKIGLTGTKGKTTTSYMLKNCIEAAGHKCGLIGTIGAIIDDEVIPSKNTTPESYEIHRMFRAMIEAGCDYVVMEVSSQGLKMNRVAGIEFDYGIFTNLSEDHIGPNEHSNFDEYKSCKSLLFKQCKVGIVNADDKYVIDVLKGHTCRVVTYGFNEGCDLLGSGMLLNRNGSCLGISFNVAGLYNGTVDISIPGKFSAYNGLTCMTVCALCNFDFNTVRQALSKVHVKGRLEIVPIDREYTVMIDYAHNEVSVESLLTTIKDYNPRHIICVYGGGGNRAKSRRYAMGELCGKMADLSILTCDNPRDEEISDINNDIKIGLARSNGKYEEVLDRCQAVHRAMDIAESGDIIILLGKGHEQYQEIKGTKHHYSETESVLSYFN